MDLTAAEESFPCTTEMLTPALSKMAPSSMTHVMPPPSIPWENTAMLIMKKRVAE